MSVYESHAICVSCYGAMFPGRVPTRLKEPPLENCCYCGLPTVTGIYVRGRREDAPHCECEKE